MNVKELIEKLQELDQELEVAVERDDACWSAAEAAIVIKLYPYCGDTWTIRRPDDLRIKSVSMVAIL